MRREQLLSALTAFATLLLCMGMPACAELQTGAATPSQASAPLAGSVFLVPENIGTGEGEVLAVEAGELFVPETHARPQGRLISTAFLRLRSTAPEPATPVFWLAGGPGESAIDDFTNDPETRAIVLFLREIADVVLVDQRGAGHSRPRLDCPQRIAWPLDEPLTREAHARELRRQSAKCRADWERLGVDLEAYNTIENAADVDMLRRSLGYRRVSLVAVSYGTHLSLALMRYFPASIERAILFGIEGPDHTYDVPSQVLAVLARIAAAAEASPALSKSIPPGGLIAALREVHARVARSPVTVTFEHEGRTVTVGIGPRDTERLARRGVGDSSDMRWPAQVIDMYGGNFDDAARSVLEDRTWPIDSAMYSMMDCASGISAPRRKLVRDDPAELSAMQVVGDLNLAYFATCEVWGNPDLGTEFRSDLRADTPVLFIQGTWDVSTPPVNAAEVARGFRNGHLLTVERGTHFALYDLFQSWDGIRPLTRDFLRGRSIHPPERVTLPEPVFRQPATAPVTQ
jgi:pimeloyl-ACP methyl ester carboxylesterase